MDENISVENVEQGSTLDDAALAPVEPQEGPQAEPISSILEGGDADSKASSEGSKDGQHPPATEPGWIKGRVDKAVRKAVAETEQRMKAEFQATLAPLYESMLERQADDLVRSGEFRSKDTAMEYLRLKNGQPVKAAEQPNQQPARDAQGRFAPARRNTGAEESDPVAAARADLLARQAEKLKSNQGLDVMGAFNANPDYRQKVLSGEWDFHDVADAMRQEENPPRRTPPSPMRSANGAAPSTFDVSKMSDAQFAKLQAALAAGKIFDVTK